MANIVFNIAKGRVAEYVNRVDLGDPSTSRIILVPIETSGLEADSVLIDKDDLAAVLSGTTNEQATMGRKILTGADFAAVAADDGNDRMDISLPTVTWTAASGNAISKILVCYAPDSGGADGTFIPLTMFDAAATPDGNDIQLTTGVFYRAS